MKPMEVLRWDTAKLSKCENVALWCQTSKVVFGLNSFISLTTQVTFVALSPKRCFTFSSALAEMSSTVIFSNPSASK